MSPSPLQSIGREEEVDANDRVLLELNFRSANDEKRLLSSLAEDEARYDVYKEAYAEVLYRYGAMGLRNEVLKTVSHKAQDQRGISLGLICGSCNSRTIDPVCSSCHDFAMRCSVCQLVATATMPSFQLEQSETDHATGITRSHSF
ncbi:GATOR complex protein wdr59 [Phytophthora boehmeriae]|uniref:GATOR complex protein wdr59 n=1 Tax=Phytophthora boehmeriae TaxID=109152 RepID=A0A8T1WVN4_9STRA|nr:GATOR complex protein wdr59 [Phytophthora boehmeriae]